MNSKNRQSKDRWNVMLSAVCVLLVSVAGCDDAAPQRVNDPAEAERQIAMLEHQFGPLPPGTLPDDIPAYPRWRLAFFFDIASEEARFKADASGGVSAQAPADLDTVKAYYLNGMKERGWTYVEEISKEDRGVKETAMTFTKGVRSAHVSLHIKYIGYTSVGLTWRTKIGTASEG